jgi:hypothetical protein
MVAGQKVALGRERRHQSVTIAVSETTLAIELDGGDTRLVRRTTDHAVHSIKEQRRPRRGRPDERTTRDDRISPRGDDGLDTTPVPR